MPSPYGSKKDRYILGVSTPVGDVDLHGESNRVAREPNKVVTSAGWWEANRLVGLGASWPARGAKQGE